MGRKRHTPGRRSPDTTGSTANGAPSWGLLIVVLMAVLIPLWMSIRDDIHTRFLAESQKRYVAAEGTVTAIDPRRDVEVSLFTTETRVFTVHEVTYVFDGEEYTKEWRYDPGSSPSRVLGDHVTIYVNPNAPGFTSSTPAPRPSLVRSVINYVVVAAMVLAVGWRIRWEIRHRQA